MSVLQLVTYTPLIGIIYSQQALSCVMEMATSEHLTLTPTIICELHHTMLQGTQTVYLNDRDTFKYCAVGVTRQATQINVTARLPTGKMIQFCPHTEVDSYMAYFCHRFNVSEPSLILSEYVYL